MTGTQKE